MIDIQGKLEEIGPYVPQDDDDMLICRCEEVTKGEIRKAVHAGMFTTYQFFTGADFRRWFALN